MYVCMYVYMSKTLTQSLKRGKYEGSGWLKLTETNILYRVRNDTRDEYVPPVLTINLQLILRKIP